MREEKKRGAGDGDGKPFAAKLLIFNPFLETQIDIES